MAENFPRFLGADPRGAALTRRSLLGGAGAAALLLASDLSSAQAAGSRTSSLARFTGIRFGVTRRRSYRDPHAGRTLTHDVSTWRSRPTLTGLAATQLVASWSASTPPGTAVRIQLRARSRSGAWSRWFTMGLWASSAASATTPTRTSVNDQSDAIARVSTDTLKAQSGVTIDAFQVQLELMRPPGTRLAPKVWQVCVASSTTPASTTPVSPAGVARGVNLAVPAYSQMLHVGHYPQWNGGGEAWCSAASTAMVLDYWKVGPTATETAWVRPTPHTNPQVEQVVRGVWDAGYQGTGNWPFNVAYASARGLTGFVTRLRSLNEAERFLKAGIPLVVSTSFSRSQLTGAGFGTNGHLMVIRGFDDAGNVRVNDPASGMQASNGLVPRTYNRAQFESAWGRSGGLTYVMHPFGRALPARPAGLAAW
ncbi:MULTISPECIES: peptidase C39 family protein [unclassified Luteococcus]|uniref:peptidase C39 family protein n=1 Tax=unclassified Luteococcus TaxID=2639923 RepID=UPI00313BA3C2